MNKRKKSPSPCLWNSKISKIDGNGVENIKGLKHFNKQGSCRNTSASLWMTYKAPKESCYVLKDYYSWRKRANNLCDRKYQ